MILFNSSDGINDIAEARLNIGSSLNYKLTPIEFKPISKYCYELEFIIENTTNAELILPLVAMEHCRNNICVSLYLKRQQHIENPEIICEYYNAPVELRRYIYQQSLHLDTNRGRIICMSGYISAFHKFIFSFSENSNYDMIHGQILDKYREYRLSLSKSFKFAIDYREYTYIDEKEFANIIYGLSIEFDVYCQISNDLSTWTLYFEK